MRLDTEVQWRCVRCEEVLSTSILPPQLEECPHCGRGLPVTWAQSPEGYPNLLIAFPDSLPQRL